MFDIGWMEMLVIGTVALVFVGPKDLPAMFRTLGQVTGKMRGMAREFQRTMEQAANESGLNEVNKAMSPLRNMGLDQATNSARDYAKSMVMGTNKPKPAVPVKPAVAAAPVAAAAPVVEPAKPAAKPKAKAKAAAKPKPKKSDKAE